jgi:integrase
MSLANHVHRERGSGRYHARLRVPKDLIEIVGKGELWKSGETTDPKEAKRAIARQVEDWRAWFDELRQQRDEAAQRTKPSASDIQRVAFEFYGQEVQGDLTARMHRPQDADIEAIVEAALARVAAGEQSQEDALQPLGASLDVRVARDASKNDRRQRAALIVELRKHIADGQTVLVRDIADGIIARERFAIERSSIDYRRLCQHLQRAWLEALQRAAEHDEGKFGGLPTDPAVRAPAGVPAVAKALPGLSIIVMLEKFIKENPRDIVPDTLKQTRTVVTLFAEFVGIASPVTEITRVAVRDWKEALFKWPARASVIGAFKGMTFREIIKANEKLEKPAIDRKTLNRYLSNLSTFCAWLRASVYLDENPVEGMSLTTDKDESKVSPYSPAQLNAIFSSPVFVGAKSDRQDWLPGDAKIRDERYWVPLIGLFTGARLGEIAQLLVEDVKQLHGEWVFHITREGDPDKTTKTKGSQRVVPVHPELVKLGLLQYLASMTAAKSRRLFPAIERDSSGHASSDISRWWGRYMTRIKVKADRSINFHSFRHGLADAMRRAGYLDAEFSFLMGHTAATMTGRYGSMPEGMLNKRVEMIGKVAFPGLDLSHLHA